MNSIDLQGAPNDRRAFFHKKIFGAIGGAVKGFVSGGPLGAVSGGIRGLAGSGGSRDPVSAVPGRTAFDPRTFIEPIFKRFPIQPATSRCDPPNQIINGRCQAPTSGIRGKIERLLPGGRTGFGPVDFPGNAVMGQFGAALEPTIVDQEVSRCPRGSVLGKDGLCYNKRDLRNSERMWPRGRRPLLTGGDMRAISIAASAAKKLQRKEKQLVSMGMLPHKHARKPRSLPAGHSAKLSH